MKLQNQQLLIKSDQKIYTLVYEKTMRITKIMIVLLLCIGLTSCFDRIDAYQQIMIYYEENSFMPIMHVYYNKHFSKSKQFQSFIEIIEETDYQVAPYAKILLTDCENQKNDQNMACKEIKRLNENRMIIGYQPNSKFTNFGDKLMQSPPQNRLFDHHSDIYMVEGFVRFINQLVPNFLKQIKNTQEFEEFKKPLYVPKLIFAAQQGEVPQVMKQLGVQFFLKFDMGYVEDLTESVVNMMQIRRFPSLMVLKHNFETGKLEIFHYDSQDFSEDQYPKIRKFLSVYALKQRRNDNIFHLIKMPREAQIQTVDSSSRLEETVNRIQSWVFLQQGPSFSELVEVKNKYGLFYDYIHYYKPDANSSRLYMLNPRTNFKIDFNQRNIQYRFLNAQDLQSNMTIWLKKDYVVMGVRQQYGYLCTIVGKPLFSQLAQCFIIDENSYQQVSENINMKFKYGFVLSAKSSNNSTTKVNGNQIKSLNFEEVYRTLQYATRMKVKDITDEFMDHTVKNITTTTDIQELCNQPQKKCIFYFYQPSTDNTKLDYLDLEAKDFINQYKIYALDLSCNEHFYDEIPQFRESHGGLIAYHPRLNKYVYLKAKMTRNVIRKFLEINNQDKKSLPFKSFSTDRTPLYDCSQQSNQNHQKEKEKINQNDQNHGQFVEQL